MGFTSVKAIGRARVLVHLVVRHFFVFSLWRLGHLSMRSATMWHVKPRPLIIAARVCSFLIIIVDRGAF